MSSNCTRVLVLEIVITWSGLHVTYQFTCHTLTDIRQRVQQVSRQLRERINTIPSDAPSEDSDSNSGLLDSFPNNATEAGHSQTQIDRHVVAAGVTDTTQHCSRQTSPPVHRNPNSDCHLIPQPKHYATSCLPLKRRLLAEQSRLCGNQSLGDDADRTFRPKTWINPAVTSNSRSSNMISSSESLVWRPYLDWHAHWRTHTQCSLSSCRPTAFKRYSFQSRCDFYSNKRSDIHIARYSLVAFESWAAYLPVCTGFLQQHEQSTVKYY